MKMKWITKLLGLEETKTEFNNRHWYLVSRIENLEKRALEDRFNIKDAESKIEIMQVYLNEVRIKLREAEKAQLS